MNMSSGHQEKKQLYYPFGIFYQCYTLAQMYTTELPSLVFTKQSYRRLVQWNVESLWGGGSDRRGQHALHMVRNKSGMSETDTGLEPECSSVCICSNHTS